MRTLALTLGLIALALGLERGDPAQTWDDLKPFHCYKPCPPQFFGDWPTITICLETDYV